MLETVRCRGSYGREPREDPSLKPVKTGGLAAASEVRLEREPPLGNLCCSLAGDPKPG